MPNRLSDEKASRIEAMLLNREIVAVASPS
jgi:hypothetical protein